ncbi:MAG: ATP synthase F1 subunit gamma [Bacteroidota bacterium]
MGANLKEVRNRIKSVTNTQQITKAMKMVSAAKLRRAQERIVQMRPYSNKLNEMMSNIFSGGSDISLDFAKEREVKNVLLVVVTSDRGLCGGFNSNIIKTARRAITEKYAQQNAAGTLTILPVGKKALEYFRRLNYKVIPDFSQLFTTLNFESASKVSQYMMDKYSDKTYDKIEIFYSQFKNAATQIFAEEAFLPVEKVKPVAGKTKKKDFIYEPGKEEIVTYLVPKILNTQFFKVLLDSNASEHGARMTAMDKASENANEMLKDLRITYNRARQAAITTELNEIVSGANALAEA